jgi:FkbM family methyltransferase
MTVFHKIINAIANRISFGPSDRRDLIETALRQLPEVAYWRLREQGFSPGGIVDIGAHEGHWTRTIRGIFSSPPILMIEAREEQERALQQVSSDLPNVDYIFSLLGRETHDSVPFHVSGTGSSIFSERSDATQVLRTIPMRTLDDVLSNSKSLAEPLFLKLDIQGAELECLQGGNATLLRTEVVQLEVALVDYNGGAPKAAETISFMNDHGFAIFDVAGFVRPNGVNLVQVDIIFVRNNSRLRPDFFSFNRR